MKIVALFVGCMALVACQSPDTTPQPVKIVSIGGTTTETLVALGLEDQLIAVDITSTFPPSVQEKQNLGHVSQIKIESLLALPGITHVVAQEGLLSEKLLTQLDGITLIEVPLVYTLDGAKAFISALGKAFDQNTKALEIIQQIDNDLEEVTAISSDTSLLFVYGRGAGALSVAGRGTVQDALMNLIHCDNTAKEFEGFKQLSPEILALYDPSHLLFFDHTFELLGGRKGITSIPGLQATTAGKGEQYIVMETSLIGNFGPRLGKAAIALSKALQ